MSMSRTRKWLLGIGITVGALLAVVAIVLGWLLYTPSGLRFALNLGVAATDGQFAYAHATGTLAGEAVITDLHYRDEDGTTTRIERAAVDLQPWELLARRLRVRKARIDGIDVAMAPSSQPGEANAPSGGESGFSLRPPIDMVLDDALLTRITIRENGTTAYEVDSLSIAGRWTRNRLELARLALRARAGSADLEGKLEFTKGYHGEGHATLDWVHQGTRYQAEFTTRAADGKATLTGTVTSPIAARVEATYALRTRAWTVSVEVPQFARGVLPVLPDSVKALAVDLHGSGTGRSGQFTGNVAVDGHHVRVDPLAFRYDGTTLTLDPVRVHAREGDGVATVAGTVQLGSSPATASLHAQWQDVELPADLAGQTLATHGEVRIEGSAEQFAVKGGLSIGPPGQLSDLQLDLAGSTQSITVNTLQLVQQGGGLTAQGRVDLKPRIGWQIDAVAKQFDPGAILAGWNGALDFKLATTGDITHKGPEASVKLTGANGTLRGRSIAGSSADFSIAPGNLLAGSLNLTVGNSRIRATGTRGEQTNADLDIDIASLGDWLPGASGNMRGQFHVKGSWPALAVRGQLTGNQLAVSGNRVGSLRASVAITDLGHPSGNVDVVASGVHAAGLDFDEIRLAANGNQARHTATLNLRGPQVGLAASLTGSWQAASRHWSGTLSGVEITPQGMPAWRQQQPAALAWKNGAATLGELCLSSGAPRLCVSGTRDARGVLAATYTLDGLPMQTLATLAPGANPLRVTGDISGSGQINRAPDGTLRGQANLAATPGSLAFASNPDQALASWTTITADASTANGSHQLAMNLALGGGGHVTANVASSAGTGALQGAIDIDLRSLAFLTALSPRIANVHGAVTGRLGLGGTMDAPRFSGRIETSGSSAELPEAGLELHDGAFAIASDTQGQLRITGQLTSGEGVLRLDGSMGFGRDAPFAFTIRGDKVLVADIPAAHVLASPDLRITRGDGALMLTGSVTIPSAKVNVERLPTEEGGAGAAVRASPDIVVVDEPPPEPAGSMPFFANVTVILGDDVQLRGYGLDGRVQGRLAVESQPGRVPTGRGQIAVTGTFTGFGQTLTIERGQLLFAGTPLDNPGLDIRAVRHLRNQDITVGMAIRGNANAPVLSVFSNPAMQQAEVLAYLVTGRPLDLMSNNEGSSVDAAAQAIGGVLGNRIAGNIGARMGLQMGVSSSEALGGTAFTTGRYLSPRLFLSYGVGLFVPGQVITLRFMINSFLNFEAENATTGNRASLNYRIER